MLTHPTAPQILQAVIAWMEQSQRTSASENSYLSLVARNALGIVLRELEQSPHSLLHHDAHRAEVLDAIVDAENGGPDVLLSRAIVDQSRRGTDQEPEALATVLRLGLRLGWREQAGVWIVVIFILELD